MTETTESFWRGLCTGILAACNIWGLGMFLQMMSYAALARELSWELGAILASTYLVWGLPGQIAMVDMTAAGASLLTVGIAVAMANARMAAMTVSSIPLLPAKSFFGRLLMAQAIGITLWLYTRESLSEIPLKARRARFAGFALLMFLAAGFGNVLGYTSQAVLPESAYRLLVYLGPVFLLLVISAARQKMYRFSVLIGALFCVAFTPFMGTTAVVVAGIVGGSLSYILARRYTAHE